ncbi:MAG: class I tRNA ligase family protein, partial [Halorhabdus sp.]
PEKEFAWSAEGVRSAHDFLQSLYTLSLEYARGDVATGDDTTIAAYVDREIEATAARATTEYEDFRFNHALQAVRELVSLLRRYREVTAVDPDTFEDGLVTATKLLAPVAPHVSEEIWDELGGEGLLAEADWPDSEAPAEYDLERRLIDDTREDVRDIVETVGIEDPDEITLAIAPEWMHQVADVARDAENVVPAVMQNEDLQQHGEEAADYAKELAGRGHVEAFLPPEREQATLERAAWLIEREFDADVTVFSAEDAPDTLASTAEPGRPAIDIAE